MHQMYLQSALRSLNSSAFPPDLPTPTLRPMILPIITKNTSYIFFELTPCCVAGLLCDLLWSDPDKDVNGWGENDRGVSFTFGADVVSKFLHRHDLDLICRAHQVRTRISPWGQGVVHCVQ